MRSLLAIVVVGGLVVSGLHALVRTSSIEPALVTPQTNIHLEFSGAAGPRLYRVGQELSRGERYDRPKLIALTFDDGPYPVFTPMLLDVLRELNIPATFFLIGKDASQWPELTRRIESEGNEVADHTYSHPNLDEESDDQVRHEILEGRDVLWTLTKDPAVRTLMRPPHRPLQRAHVGGRTIAGIFGRAVDRRQRRLALGAHRPSGASSPRTCNRARDRVAP